MQKFETEMALTFERKEFDKPKEKLFVLEKMLNLCIVEDCEKCKNLS